MKKTMIILIGLMLSMIASAQPNFMICRPSEAEVNTETSEAYFKLFFEKHNSNEYHWVINVIGDGTIANEIKSIREKGLNEFADAVRRLEYVDEIKTCFVSNGKFYVLTYKPDKNRFNTNITRGIYLYRRDDDSMRIASDLICNDTRIDGKYQRETELNAGKECYSTYSISDTTLLKETPARVFVVDTKEWYPGDNYVYGTMVILLIPDGNNGYRSACFESDKRFAVNQIESTSTNGKLMLKYQSGTIEFNVVDNNVVVGGTIKLKRQ